MSITGSAAPTLHGQVSSDNKVVTKRRGTDDLPIDRGWAWVIMIANFCILTFVAGYFRSMGILFVEFLSVYQTPASYTSLVLGIQGAVLCVSGFIAQNILMSFLTVRSMVMTGGSLAGIGIGLSYFAKSLDAIILLQGVLLATGIGLAVGPTIVLLGSYFDKRRSLANGIANAGGNVGAICGPLLVRNLLDNYGLRGTFLIVGGLLMHITAAGALLRPLRQTKKQKSSAESESKKKLSSNMTNIQAKYQEENVSDTEVQPFGIVPETDIPPKLDIKLSKEKSSLRYISSSDIFCVSLQDLRKDQEDEDIASAELLHGRNYERQKKKKNILKNVLKQFDFSLFKQKIFLLLMTSLAFGIFVASPMGAYIPPLANDNDVDKSKQALLMSLTGVSGIVSRVSVGFFADLGTIKRANILAFALTVAGIVAFLTPVCNTFESLVVFSFTYGFFGALFYSLQSVVIIDFLGLHKLPKCLGFAFLFQGMTLAGVYPLTGYLRDVTGSYTAPYQLMAAAAFVSAACLPLEPLVRGLGNKKTSELEDVREEIQIPLKELDGTE